MESKKLEFITIEQAVEYCQVSRRHIETEIKRKNLRCYKPGKRLLFSIEDLNKWIKQKAVS